MRLPGVTVEEKSKRPLNVLHTIEAADAVALLDDVAQNLGKALAEVLVRTLSAHSDERIHRHLEKPRKLANSQ